MLANLKSANSQVRPDSVYYNRPTLSSRASYPPRDSNGALSDMMANHHHRGDVGGGRDTSALPAGLDEGISSTSRLISAWHGRYRATKTTCPDLERFFSQRAALEEEFAHRLMKLAQQPLGEGESWGLGASLRAAKQEVEVAAAAHLQLATKIQEELQAPSASQAVQLGTTKRNILNGILPKQQMHISSMYMLDRAKERCQEARQAGGDGARFGAEQEMQLAIARYEDATHNLQLEEERAADSFRQLELSRVQFVRNSLWKYANLLSGTCVVDDESLERVRGTLETCDAKSEVESFVTTLRSPSPSGPSSSEEDNKPLVATASLAAFPGRGSPLRNEIRKPNEPRFNQLVSSLGAPAHSEPSPRANAERSKLISSDLVSATIARSPILAAKRSSGGGRPVSSPVDQTPHRPQSTGPPVRAHSIADRSFVAGTPPRTNPSTRSISPPDNHFPHSSSLQRSYSGTSQPNSNPQGQQQQSYPGRPPYPPNSNNAPSYPYHTMSYSGGIPDHVRQQRPPSPPQSANFQPPTAKPSQTYPPPSNSSVSVQSASAAYPPPPTSAPTNPPEKPSGEGRPILFYVKAVYDYDAEIPEEIALREGQVVAVLATQLDGWWEGEVQDPNGTIRRGIFPSNFTEPVSL